MKQTRDVKEPQSSTPQVSTGGGGSASPGRRALHGLDYPSQVAQITPPPSPQHRPSPHRHAPHPRAPHRAAPPRDRTPVGPTPPTPIRPEAQPQPAPIQPHGPTEAVPAGAAESARILADFDNQAREALTAASAFLPQSAPHFRGQIAQARIALMAAYRAGITNANPYESGSSFHSANGPSTVRSGMERVVTGPGERAVWIQVSAHINRNNRIVVGVSHVELGEQTTWVPISNPRGALVHNANGNRDTHVTYGSLRDRFGR